MQPAHIELREIIWEITDNCNNNCDYCGSKDILNRTPIDITELKEAIDKIAEYPPIELNISGGDPILVPLDVHLYLREKLNGKSILKIIVNPHSSSMYRYHDVINMYDRVGMSINSWEDLYILQQTENLFDSNKTTIITNFNTNNLFLFDDILKFCIENKSLIWQIQYTMYDGFNPFAIYSNNSAKKYLFDKIKESNYTRLVLADNLNNGQCTAGKYSCGILANGELIPCLSMRSWDKKHSNYGSGNLYIDSLKTIWENNFGLFRCSEYECCKDRCNAPYIEEFNSIFDNITIAGTKKKFIVPSVEPQVVMYGVSAYPPWDKTMVYGVTREPIVMAYGVLNNDIYTNNSINDSCNTTTSGFKDWSTNNEK